MAHSTTADALTIEHRRWLAEVDRSTEKQLTIRAVIAGMLIGMVMCLSNLYVVLKTGWSVGVTLTASIMGWAVVSALKKARLSNAPLGLLENGAIGSVASGAGYMTGGGNMAALPALIMLTGIRPDAFFLVFWFAGIAALGVFAAIPIKRQLINQDHLAFPTGTATAETLRALHTHGEVGARKAKLLAWSSLTGAMVAWFRDAKASWMPFNLPATFAPSWTLRGRPIADWTIAAEGSLLMLGAGALMSFRTGWSMLLGSLSMFGVLAPAMVDLGAISDVGFKPIANWSVWLGASILVSSGLTSFAFQWRSVAQSFKGLGALFARRKDPSADDDVLARVECPPSWFPLGFLVIGPVVVVLASYAFNIPMWAGLIALPLAVVLGIIAARVTGETDVTPTKALGPVTQLLYAALLPKQLVPNIMIANVTGGVGLHAADLLTDLKCGYLIGARPRQQLMAQLFGVLAGSLVLVPAFNMLVPDASILGSKEFPAPSAQVWANVSKMLVEGVSALHPTARWAALIGLCVGTILGIGEAKLPASIKKYTPSPSGLGIAMVIPAYNSIMMFLGALGAEMLRRKRGVKEGDDFSMPVASGFIAGESLLGIAVKMLVAFGVMSK